MRQDVTLILCNTDIMQSRAQAPDWMPEWSKGEDLRSSVFALAGSNPAPVIFYFKHLTLFIKSLLLYFITRFSLSYRFPIYPSPTRLYSIKY